MLVRRGPALRACARVRVESSERRRKVARALRSVRMRVRGDTVVGGRPCF